MKTIITLIRVAIGWHFLYEGCIKLFAQAWSSASYLNNTSGVLSGFYHWLAAAPVQLAIVDFLNVWGLVLIGLALFIGLFARWAALAGVLMLMLYYFAYPPFGPTLLAGDGMVFIINQMVIEAAILIFFIGYREMGYGLDSLIQFLKKKKELETVHGETTTVVSTRRQLLKDLATLPVLGLFGWGVWKNIKLYGINTLTGATMQIDQTTPDEPKNEQPRSSANTAQTPTDYSGPEDGPNQPFGKPAGIFPGRVVWAWDPAATNENCLNTFESKDFYFKPENTNKEVVRKMLRSALPKLTGADTVKDSWDAIFNHFNDNKHHTGRGYKKGEKIFIKINQGTSRWLLTDEDKAGGYYYPQTFEPASTPGGRREADVYGACESNPYVVLEVLKQLVVDCGIAQENIYVGDPMTHIYGHLFEVVYAEFPKVKYVDKRAAHHHRTIIKVTEKDYLLYANNLKDPLFDFIVKADYLINIANLKPHGAACVSMLAKNHFGTHGRENASHLHPSLVNVGRTAGTNGGYRKYRAFVDLMGSKYLGRNTVIHIVDGLFGGGSTETKGPVKYFMPPFNNNWSNSIFVSLDQVALESVGFDFLRSEWNGTNTHSRNNRNESFPNIRGVDDHLHQAADRSNWPEGIVYDPDGSGKPIPSLGVHEHWNNPVDKQYSVNLGTGKGIELISIPDHLVRSIVRN